MKQDGTEAANIARDIFVSEFITGKLTDKPYDAAKMRLHEACVVSDWETDLLTTAGFPKRDIPNGKQTGSLTSLKASRMKRGCGPFRVRLTSIPEEHLIFDDTSPPCLYLLDYKSIQRFYPSHETGAAKL